MKIQPIRPGQFATAIDVMASVGHELRGVTLDMIRKVDLLPDLCFLPIPQYRANTSCTCFMEKVL